jgi:hypothetical protein
MSLGEGTLYALIVGCEVAFWVALFSGLAFRYVLRWGRVSSFVLWCVPLIDVTLLAFTVLDLRSGTVATFAHGLATAYVGFTVAFGPITISWADQRFGHKFGGGPPPSKPPSRGWASVLYELKLWARCLLAIFIIYLLLCRSAKQDTGAGNLVSDSTRNGVLLVCLRSALATDLFQT